jgi:hypothetical protein
VCPDVPSDHRVTPRKQRLWQARRVDNACILEYPCIKTKLVINEHCRWSSLSTPALGLYRLGSAFLCLKPML